MDDILIFHRLSLDQLRQIVDLQAARLAKLLEERQMRLELTDRPKEFLANEGYDPVYGARPLRRAIQRHLQDKLAPLILEVKFKEGDTIVVDVDAAGLTFQRQEPELLAAAN